MDTTSLEFYLNLLVAVLVLTLPGGAIYLLACRLFGKREARPSIEMLVATPALSIAFWPLLLLYTSLAGGGFSAVLLWVVLAVCGLIAGLLAWDAWKPAGQGDVPRARKAGTPGTMLLGSALFGLTGLSLAYRLGDIQGLAVPMFGDSLHHTLITKLIIDRGQVPSGYLPYVPVDTFTYHFGFHTLAAVVALLVGTTAPYAVLLVGQVLNAASVPLAYLLNRVLFGSRLAGLAAGLVTGFISIMPAYYVNWGRYTQLAGQVLLSGALVFLVRTLSRDFRRSDLALMAFCVAGLVVVHYRVLIFFGLFALAYGAWQLVTSRGRPGHLARSWARGFAAVFAGLAAASPWLANLAVNYFPGLFGRLRTVTPDYLQEYNNPTSLEIFAGRLLPTLGLLGLVVGVSHLARRAARGSSKNQLSSVPERQVRPEASSVVLAIWIALLVGSLWVVPGAIGSYTVAITLYIPLAALGGYGIGWGAGQVSRLLKFSPGVLATAILIAAPFSATVLRTGHVTDPGSFQYVQPADLRAFDWVRTHTPDNARFLISSQFSYAGRGVTASDAGMWLPLLTGRSVTIPALSTWMEHPREPDFFTRTKTLAAYTQPLQTPGGADPSTQERLVVLGVLHDVQPPAGARTLAAMKEYGVTHVYSGTKEGHSTPRLDLQAMRKDARHYRQVYAQDGVVIFEVTY
ncbi:MAG TPA: DUF6541 family protein [Chloroflexia bacterium]|nr:DUF6541 family protein [Chloroflexia bacterium]